MMMTLLGRNFLEFSSLENISDLPILVTLHLYAKNFSGLQCIIVERLSCVSRPYGVYIFHLDFHLEYSTYLATEFLVCTTYLASFQCTIPFLRKSCT